VISAYPSVIANKARFETFNDQAQKMQQPIANFLTAAATANQNAAGTHSEIAAPVHQSLSALKSWQRFEKPKRKDAFAEKVIVI
jgi:hypothetical protein